MASAKTPTPIDSKKPVAKTVEPTTLEVVTDVTIPPTSKKPKLTYAQRLAAMDPEEAALVRQRANAASKASKARAKGYDSPEVVRAMRLTALLSRNQEKTQVLAEEREKIEAELQAIAEAAEQQAVETDGENAPV